MFPHSRILGLVFVSLLAASTSHAEEIIYIVEEPATSIVQDSSGNQNTHTLYGDDIPADRPLSGNYYADYEGFPNQGARNKGKQLVYAPTFQNKVTFTNDHNYVYTGSDAARIYEYPTSFEPYVRPTPKSSKSIENMFAKIASTSKPYQTIQQQELEQVVIEEDHGDVKMLLDFVSDPVYRRSGKNQGKEASIGKFMRGMISRLSTHLRHPNRKGQVKGIPGAQASQQRRNGIGSKKHQSRSSPIGYKLIAPYDQQQGSSPGRPQ